MTYVPKYREYMAQAKVRLDELPLGLQEIIALFAKANTAWDEAGQPQAYLKILVQSDACISAEIFSLFLKQPDKVNLDKVKMMALKAKALKLKWKLK